MESVTQVWLSSFSRERLWQEVHQGKIFPPHSQPSRNGSFHSAARHLEQAWRNSSFPKKTVTQTNGMEESPIREVHLRPFILILFNSNLDSLANTSIGTKFSQSTAGQDQLCLVNPNFLQPKGQFKQHCLTNTWRIKEIEISLGTDKESTSDTYFGPYNPKPASRIHKMKPLLPLQIIWLLPVIDVRLCYQSEKHQRKCRAVVAVAAATTWKHKDEADNRNPAEKDSRAASTVEISPHRRVNRKVLRRDSSPPITRSDLPQEAGLHGLRCSPGAQQPLGYTVAGWQGGKGEAR